PRTLLRWHQRLVARRGYRRIVGEPRGLGFSVSASSVRAILNRASAAAAARARRSQLEVVPAPAGRDDACLRFPDGRDRLADPDPPTRLSQIAGLLLRRRISGLGTPVCRQVFQNRTVH